MRQRRPVAIAVLILLNLSLLLLGAGWTASPAGVSAVTLNGVPLAARGTPAIMNGRILFPVRPLAAALGADVAWDGRRREVIVTRGGRRIILRIGQLWATVDGRRVPLEGAPILWEGQSFVPLRFLSEALGAEVYWDPATRTASIAYGREVPAPPPPQALPDRPAVGPLAPRGGDYLVLGYAPVDWPGDRLALRSLQAYAQHIDAVAYFGLFLDRHGNLTNPGGDSRELRDAARRSGQAVLLTVHNATPGGFDRAGARALLNDAGARARAVENIHRAVAEGGYAGVNLDLEAIDAADRDRYTSFVRALADRLRPAGLAVTVAVPAKTSDDRRNNWSGAFDYAALGRIADALVIMAYDEHWPGGPPGPVASLGWAERVARYAASTVPPRKVLFGIAGYGYDWTVSTGETVALSAPSAAQKAARLGVKVLWDPAAQVPYYEYWDGQGHRHLVYYENASSMAAKIDLVTRHRFAGIALWRLGLEDPESWQGVIHGKLKAPRLASR